jgi:hypothetical protein
VSQAACTTGPSATCTAASTADGSGAADSSSSSLLAAARPTPFGAPLGGTIPSSWPCSSRRPYAPISWPCWARRTPCQQSPREHAAWRCSVGMGPLPTGRALQVSNEMLGNFQTSLQWCLGYHNELNQQEPQCLPPFGNDKILTPRFRCRQPSAWKSVRKIYGYCVSTLNYVSAQFQTRRQSRASSWFVFFAYCLQLSDCLSLPRSISKQPAHANIQKKVSKQLGELKALNKSWRHQPQRQGRWHYGGLHPWTPGVTMDDFIHGHHRERETKWSEAKQQNWRRTFRTFPETSTFRVRIVASLSWKNSRKHSFRMKTRKNKSWNQISYLHRFLIKGFGLFVDFASNTGNQVTTL